jgi:ribonuclease BN (tRNA processing enzyme)
VLDAGSGLRSYARQLEPAARTGHHVILLSHSHWDHICGLPFFLPLYEAGATVTVLGPDQPSATLDTIVRGLLAPATWPLPPACDLVILGIASPAFSAAGFRVRSCRTSHAGVTLSYRIVTESGRSVSYVTDNELAAMHPEGRRELVQHVAGSDVLVHDATWSGAIAAGRGGWGHSSVGEAVALGMEAGCRTVVLFHHDPDADDDSLERNLAEAERMVAGSSTRVLMARDGMTLEL